MEFDQLITTSESHRTSDEDNELFRLFVVRLLLPMLTSVAASSVAISDISPLSDETNIKFAMFSPIVTSATCLDFPVSLNSLQRLIVHEVAGIFFFYVSAH